MRLLLIRHGETPNNVRGALDTAPPGAGLTELGHAQARAVPAALGDEDVSAVYVSTLTRTHLTAAPLARERGVEVRVHPGLEEVAAGDLELREDDAAVGEYRGCLTSWMTGDLGRRIPGGQSGYEFVARYTEAVRGVVDAHPESATVAVVAHGAAIRVFTAVAARVEPDRARGLRLANTGLSVLEGGDRWRLARWVEDPLGGPHLRDTAVHDVTGDGADAAEAPSPR